MDIKKILFKTNEIDVEKSLPDAIIYCNRDGKILWVNDKAQELFDTSKMHLLTSKITDFIENPLDLASNSALLNKPVITKVIHKDIYFDMTAKEIEDGFVLDFRNSCSASLNLDEKDNTEEVNRNKNSFLVKLANDFKSPLQSIVGFAQAMTDGLGGEMSEQQEKYIKIIRKNSSELMYFVNKLIDLSQTELNERKVEHKTFDVVSTTNAIVKFNEQLYKDKDVRWTTSFENMTKNTISSDEEIVKTILQNVLEIVVRSIDIGEIKVDVSLADEELVNAKGIMSGSHILISISSTSLLLSENDLDCLFDPYKIIDTTNRKNLLRAMQLASVKNLIQALKGNVWVESVILKSTKFNVLIPISNN